MFDWTRYQFRKLFRPRVISTGGVKLDLGDIARTRYARSFYRGDHERDEREIVARHLGADDIVLELGAGMGLVTIECCRRIGSERIFTYEANPTLEPLLRRNFSLNGVSPRLEMRMVSLDAGPQDFFVADRFVLSSRHAAATAQKNGTSTRTRIDSIPLAEVLAEVRPSFLIVDIEGGEADLAAESVSLAGVNKLCIEMHPHIIGDDGVSRVASALIAKGFRLCVGESRGAVLFFSRSPESLQAAA
jgi:FkbM family methyltransferase